MEKRRGGEVKRRRKQPYQNSLNVSGGGGLKTKNNKLQKGKQKGE